ncbi:cytochrome P450 [Solirhodobacter olei]|uniref:cytochrome P450 n=1 Tax=Solirhodobacter olei TaxID=2493082 RepID=UPI000FDB0911|nr:cytochrome P450 [Solirhodobacter olei]
MTDCTPLSRDRSWPGIAAPARPYPAPLFLYHFVRNPLRCLPRSVYEEPIVPYRIGALRTAWVTDPDLTETIFLSHHAAFPKPPLEQRVFSDPLGKSILTSQGEDWRWQRHAVSGLFRHEDILGYVPGMASAAEALLARWHGTGAGPRRIDHALTGATYEAISTTLFGGEALPEGRAIQTAVDHYLNATSWVIAATLAGLPDWSWHPGQGRMRRASQAMRAAVERLLDRWQAGGDLDGRHLLGKLLAAEEPGRDGGISRERLVNNLLTFLNAGHETTAKALIWTLYLLAQEPVWQDRLREEAFAIAGTGPIEGRHIDRLSLTRQVFEEAMRLYAPAPVLTRLAAEDCDLGGVRLNAGSVIFIPIWAVHRHRRLWSEPEMFRPERFAPDLRGTIRRTQFMPFGFGPRICIGTAFSRTEGVAMLATLLRGARFDWPGGPPPEPLARVTLWPKGGLTLNVTPLGATSPARS